MGRRAGRFLVSSKVPDRQKETAALILKAATVKIIWAWEIVCPAAAFFLSAAGQINNQNI